MLYGDILKAGAVTVVVDKLYCCIECSRRFGGTRFLHQGGNGLFLENVVKYLTDFNVLYHGIR